MTGLADGLVTGDLRAVCQLFVDTSWPTSLLVMAAAASICC